MSAQNPPIRARALFVRLLAAAVVLLGLCSGSGCEDKSTARSGEPEAVSAASLKEAPGPAKHKRTPRAPK
jgi:hypothetical protein